MSERFVSAKVSKLAVICICNAYTHAMDGTGRRSVFGLSAHLWVHSRAEALLTGLSSTSRCIDAIACKCRYPL